MAPTLILIRHASALHNVTKDDSMTDPSLTTYGAETECVELAQHLQELPLAQEISLIVTSPMLRTLQTTQYGLGWLIERGVPVIPLAQLQETTLHNCDTGRPLPILRTESPDFDWSFMDPIWPFKGSLYEYSREAILKRGQDVRRWLRNRPERVIAVVSHGAFLRLGMCNKKMANADYRILDFAEARKLENGVCEEGDETGDEEGLKLVEWESTAANGGGLGKSSKEFFGWEKDDFKGMPNPPPEDVQDELIRAGYLKM
ncbi:hypothetical protein BP6252_05582 [Coleophoma cylindrospora]|uniref:Phosphoglycerate mutase-like protein n=1 Tax=Coleophoma cylindrospora TaxID=1849047 RepID=A0A3D8RTZ9_9HELO|nr:hypothetical protein BP6252_05582 [Coleophoma cylindrospora]